MPDRLMNTQGGRGGGGAEGKCTQRFTLPLPDYLNLTECLAAEQFAGDTGYSIGWVVVACAPSSIPPPPPCTWLRAFMYIYKHNYPFSSEFYISHTSILPPPPKEVKYTDILYYLLLLSLLLLQLLLLLLRLGNSLNSQLNRPIPRRLLTSSVCVCVYVLE